MNARNVPISEHASGIGRGVVYSSTTATMTMKYQIVGVRYASRMPDHRIMPPPPAATPVHDARATRALDLCSADAAP